MANVVPGQLEEPKDITAHIGLDGLCTYGQSQISFVAYFNGIANTYHARSQTEEAQLFNEIGDFQIYVAGVQMDKKNRGVHQLRLGWQVTQRRCSDFTRLVRQKLLYVIKGTIGHGYKTAR